MVSNPVELIVPPSAPRGGNAVLAWIGRCGLRLLGWRILGEFADKKKLIVIVAPHTSNWDWVVGVCALWAMRMRFRYFIKDSLFFWPLGIMLRNTGGIPVNRNNPDGLLETTAQRFHDANQLYLAITPEGTRKAVSRWKSGFLRISYAAGVPVVPVIFDAKKREARVCPPYELSGDLEQDMKLAQSFFAEHY